MTDHEAARLARDEGIDARLDYPCYVQIAGERVAWGEHAARLARQIDVCTVAQYHHIEPMTALERWEKAARAASFLSRAADERTKTQAGWLIEDAAMLLCQAGLCDLADEVQEAAEDWRQPERDDLILRVGDAARDLGYAYLDALQESEQ
jgi:hypothetical protein